MSKFFPSKKQWIGWSMPSRIGYIGFWIAIVGMPAILITYYSLFSNYINRNPKILEVKPYVYLNEQNEIKYKDWPTPIELGLFFIVHIKNGSKVSSINGLKIKAPKYYLDANQYLGMEQHIGKTLTEIEKEWKDKKPYISIEWDAYISDKNIKKVLFPHDDAYIGFTLLDPIISGQSEGGWKMPAEKYLGYDSGKKTPTIIRKYSDFNLIFSDFNMNKLPPRTIRKDFDFYLTINNEEISIERELISFVDKLSKHSYDNDSFEKMFLRRYAE
jgi:hypothetical protein